VLDSIFGDLGEALLFGWFVNFYWSQFFLFFFVLVVHDKTCDVHTVVEAAAVVDELVGGLGHDNQADNSQNGVDDCEYKVVYVDDGCDWG
jgi:hypothetical protein